MTATPAPVYLCRAGKDGEDEDAALEHGRAIIGFRDVPDLTGATTQDAVDKAVIAAMSGVSEGTIYSHAKQLHKFRSHIKVGHTIALPLKTRSGQVALGTCTREYAYEKINGEQRHTLGVNWIRPDVSRTSFQQDMLYSLGAFTTICRISRNGAAGRFQTMLTGVPDPGSGEAVVAKASPAKLESESELDTEAEETQFDLGQAAHDQI